MLEFELLHSAVDQALARGDVQKIVESSGVSSHVLAQQLRRDRDLIFAAGHHADRMHALMSCREALAEEVRRTQDPERAYYLGGRQRPEPPDLIRDHIRPALGVATIGLAGVLWGRASGWQTPSRVLYRWALVLVVIPVAVAVPVVATILSPLPVLSGFGVCVTALALACAVGLVQRRHHRIVASRRVPLPIWLERRTSAGFEEDLQAIVEADPSVQAAMRQEAAAREEAGRDLVEHHVVPAAIRVVAELSPPPAALEPRPPGSSLHPNLQPGRPRSKVAPVRRREGPARRG